MGSRVRGHLASEWGNLQESGQGDSTLSVPVLCHTPTSAPAPALRQGHYQLSLPQAQSPPPALSLPGTMGTGMPMSSAWAHTWPPPSQPRAKWGNRPVFSQIRAQEQGEAEGQFKREHCLLTGHLSREVPPPRSPLRPETGQGTHPLQELRPLLLLVTTSRCCYFIFLPAPFPPLLFLIQLQRDGEAQVRASRCGAGQEAEVSTEQPHQWQGKERGGSHPCQQPPETWSNPDPKPGVLLPQPLTPLCGDMGTENSAVPTAGEPAGRGQKTLCRAAPSPREGRDKGNRVPSRKDGHSLSHRHLQAQLCEQTHSKHHTQSQWREAEKPERSSSWDCLLQHQCQPSHRATAVRQGQVSHPL